MHWQQKDESQQKFFAPWAGRQYIMLFGTQAKWKQCDKSILQVVLGSNSLSLMFSSCVIRANHFLLNFCFLICQTIS